MKWVGWVFAACLAVLFAVLLRNGDKSVAEVQQRLDAKVAKEGVAANKTFAADEKGIAARRERLAVETERTAKLQSQRDKLAAKKNGLQSLSTSLTKSTNRLRDAKGSLSGKQEENLEDIRELQAEVARRQNQQTLIEQALTMVSEKSP